MQTENEEIKDYSKLIKTFLPQKFGKKSCYSAYVKTFGCQQNFSDSEKIEGLVQECGFKIEKDINKADLILFNTCAIRKHAEDRVFGNLGIVKNLKEKKPTLVVAVCGCMPQQEEVLNKIKCSFSFVNLILGTNYIKNFKELLYKAITNKKVVTFNKLDDLSIPENVPTVRNNKIKALVPIMSGCNNFCSYCIVPYVRGRERSRSPKEILSEVEKLIDSGYKEIFLLGQNVNSYGKNLKENVNFAQLLNKINDIPGEYWVRFMTSHPKDITKELVNTIASCSHVCKSIHLPVQSGNNRILKDMNRKYTREQYLEIIDYINKIIPGVFLSSDIIVGFPNETEEEFLDTVSLVKKVKYSLLYTFIYSKRAGTPASKIKDNLPYEEKAKRLNLLINIQNQITDKTFESMVNTKQKVLVETKMPDSEIFLARTQGNIPVKVFSKSNILGKFLNVKINKNTRTYLQAEYE